MDLPMQAVRRPVPTSLIGTTHMTNTLYATASTPGSARAAMPCRVATPSISPIVNQPEYNANRHSTRSKNHALLIGIIALGLAACSDSDSDGSPTAPHAYEGIWQAAAYGEVLQIAQDRMQTFQYTRDYCLLVGDEDDIALSEFEAAATLSNDGQAFSFPVEYGTQDFHAPAALYHKVTALPDSCEQPVPVIGDSDYRQNYSRDFDLFWQTFDEFSVAFEKVDVDWNALYATYAPQAAAATSELALLEVYYEITKPLADGHTQIRAPGVGVAATNGKPVQYEILLEEYAEENGISLPIPAAHVDRFGQYAADQLALYESIIQQYANTGSAIKTAANDRLMWFTVNDIAYLNIRDMMGFHDDSEDHAANLVALNAGLDAAMADIRTASGLIIDIRSNNGGNDFISMAIAQRFLDTTRHVYSKQARAGNSRTALVDVTLDPAESGSYTGPIALLTSASTVSAAEVFTLIMRTLPHVTLMGEATQGAFSDMLTRALPNDFTFSLSNEYYLSAEGDWFEGPGVPVDIEVPTFTRTQRLAGEDLVIEAAFEQLTGQ